MAIFELLFAQIYNTSGAIMPFGEVLQEKL